MIRGITKIHHCAAANSFVLVFYLLLAINILNYFSHPLSIDVYYMKNENNLVDDSFDYFDIHRNKVAFT